MSSGVRFGSSYPRRARKGSRRCLGTTHVVRSSWASPGTLVSPLGLLASDAAEPIFDVCLTEDVKHLVKLGSAADRF
jgi:hypothetical protein